MPLSRVENALLPVVLATLASTACSASDAGSSSADASVAEPANAAIAAGRAFRFARPDAGGVVRVQHPIRTFSVALHPDGEVALAHAAQHGGEWSLRMHLASIGRGDTAAEPMTATMRVLDERVEYQRGPVTEWYVYGVAGVEQGFTVAERPAHGDGPLVLGISVDGVSVESKAETIVFKRRGRAVVAARDLTARDVDGVTLAARMEPTSSGIRIVVDDAHAKYPIAIDPLYTPFESKLVASDGAAGAQHGVAVAISGNTAVVGAPRADGKGAAYVYVYNGSTWTQQQKLSGATANADFGSAVAIDGDSLIVGEPDADAAYVYVRSGTTWTEQKKLTPPAGETGGGFGSSVSILGDSAAAGAPWLTYNHGMAYFFARTGTTWSAATKLANPDAPQNNDYYGQSVAIGRVMRGGSTTETVVVGAPGAGGAEFDNYGAVYLHQHAVGSTGWYSPYKRTPTDPIKFEEVGYSVAIRGPFIVAGGPREGAGSVAVWWSNGSTYDYLTRVKPSDGATTDFFGGSVGLSDNTLVVGALGDDSGAFNGAGSAYLYYISGTSFSDETKILANDMAADDFFGSSVAISGSHVVIGANGRDDKGSGSGAAYTYGAFTKKTLGASCTAGGECMSNFCVGGVCCDTACSPFTCSASGTCRTSCAESNECATGYRCADSKCVPGGGARCQDDTTSLSPDGKVVPCAPYTCDSTTGTCRPVCTDSGQCSSGNVCDLTTKSCVSPVPSSDSDSGCGCEVTGRPGSSGALFALTLALAVATRRSRRIASSGRWCV